MKPSEFQIVPHTDPSFLVDQLGYIKAQIADLKKQEDALKTAILAGGPAEYDGKLFRATVSEVSRQFIDADLARKVLTEKQLAKITKTSSTFTVRVSARKTEN